MAGACGIDDIRVYGKAAPVNAGPTNVSFISSITEIAEDADTDSTYAYW